MKTTKCGLVSYDELVGRFDYLRIGGGQGARMYAGGEQFQGEW